MNKKELLKKIKLTDVQLEALKKLDAVYNECQSLGLDFIYDYEIKNLIAVNLTDAEIHYCEEDCCTEENCIIIDEIGTSALPDTDYDDFMYEVGGTTYCNDEFDKVCYTPKGISEH